MILYFLKNSIKFLEAIRNKYKFRKFKKELPDKISELRGKDKIRCVFVVNELAIWKTEALYLALKKHPRFDPIICIAATQIVEPAITAKNYLAVKSYLERKGYDYVETANIATLKPDITFYGKPYDGVISENLWFRNNPGLTLFTMYGQNNGNTSESYNLPLVNYSTMFFVENETVRQELSPLYKFKGKNIRVTGVPITDLLLSSNIENNPWKSQDSPKKKIIWAPHFTIKHGCSWLNFSSFLSMHEFMLEFAKKYEDKVQFAFKPHPLLYPTLNAEWGKKKTDKYYDKWRNMPNTQLEEGEYIDLFKTSDAMIHDSVSFLMEYMHMNKPVLYTIREKDSLKQLNKFGLMAYENCYHGNDRETVEQFILNVINDADPMKAQRTEFYKTSLLPPHGKTACENIIDAILGQNSYK